ncbi:hypothetical protein J2741_001713 [Methanolinea mesophila]|uniref:hypothetical protein n=1 Tax=Methanolinea mesophila TaxID=547055 RepID=UPI001AE2150B|nr:hypothetical protein [Methanolinea mesophila]MBP1929166.1 hypothetical protein [Methanolinea mesophila]
MSARAKWGLYYAELNGDIVIPMNSTKDYGEGQVNEEKIKSEIIPLIQEKNLQLPILIKTYFSKKPSGLGTITREGKPAFETAYPIREQFTYLINSQFEILDVRDKNIGNLEEFSPKT